MSKFARNILFFLFVFLVLITPLLITSFTNEKYETPKVFFVYFVGLTLIFVFLLAKIFAVDRLTLVYPNKIIVLFFLTSLVSTIFSSHVYTSIWGYYSRFNDGFFLHLLFFGIYLVGINVLTLSQKKTLQDFVALTLVPTGVYGLYQILSGVPRIYSTFGQPNWFAAYLVFVLPLVLYKIISKDTKNKVFWGLIFILALSNLMFSVSLSGIAGFIVSITFFIVCLGKKINRNVVFFLLCVFLVFGVLKADYIKNKIFDAVNFSGDASQYVLSDPGYVRLGLWKSGLKIVGASPKNFLVGTGPETFPYQLPFYRNDSLNYSSEWNFILNKPHNYYLEVLVENGVVGLFSYVALIVWSLIQKDKVLVAGLLGFYISNLFGFPTVYTSLLFWLWIAFL